MAGINLDMEIGTTDRGTLWRATSETEQALIVRTIDPYYCDRDFRNALAILRERPHPRMQHIRAEGWLGAQYYIAYDGGDAWEPLEAHFERRHWRSRLSVIMQICEIYDQWIIAPISPLGLNIRNISMVKTADLWFPWLLPCPAFELDSPTDLFGKDNKIVSSIAPEIIRGMHSTERTRDMYALGALAALALGCLSSNSIVDDDSRIESQVRGLLMECELENSEFEISLFSTHATTVARNLIGTIKRYLSVSPDARPADPSILHQACEDLLRATDPYTLAQSLFSSGKYREALHMLEWGFEHFEMPHESHLMASELYEKLEHDREALKHLEYSITEETIIYVLLRRIDLRFKLYKNEKSNTDRDLLIQDLEHIQRTLPDLGAEHRGRAWTYKLLAQVHLLDKNLNAASHALYHAWEINNSDLDTIFQYADVLKQLGSPAEAVQQVVDEGLNRTRQQMELGILDKREAQIWYTKFSEL